MTKKLILPLCIIPLAGCAGSGEIRQQVAAANVRLAEAQSEALKQPLVDIKLPDGTAIVVRQPAGNVNTQQLRMPENEWARVTERAIGVVGTAGGILAGGFATSSVLNAAGDVTLGIVDTLGRPNIDNKRNFNNQTADPTVVMQPDPTVVNQPEPVIVDRDPLVVEPVVVDPVIVDRSELLPVE